MITFEFCLLCNLLLSRPFLLISTTIINLKQKLRLKSKQLRNCFVVQEVIAIDAWKKQLIRVGLVSQQENYSHAY